MFLPIFEKNCGFRSRTILISPIAPIATSMSSPSSGRHRLPAMLPFFIPALSPKYWEITNGACLGMVGWWPSDLTDYEVIARQGNMCKGFNKTFWISRSNWLAEGAYDDVLFWARGVKTLKGTNSERLIKTLEKVEVDCTRGKMKVNPI